MDDYTKYLENSISKLKDKNIELEVEVLKLQKELLRYSNIPRQIKSVVSNIYHRFLSSFEYRSKKHYKVRSIKFDNNLLQDKADKYVYEYDQKAFNPSRVLKRTKLPSSYLFGLVLLFMQKIRNIYLDKKEKGASL